MGIEKMSNINGTLREKICTALQDAFPKYTDIEQMLSFKFNEILESISGKSELKTVVFELVKKYESKGNLDKLIIAAIRQNPGNPKLIELAPEINFLSPTLSANRLSNVFDNELLPILKNINHFEIIKNACSQTLSDFPEIKINSGWEDKLEDFKKVNSEEIKSILDYFIFKKLLLQEYPELKDGTSTILKFAQYLAAHRELEESVKNKLNKWIDNTAKEHNLKCPTSSKIESSDETLQAYLLITVDDNLIVNGYLMYKEEIEPLDINFEQKGSSISSFDEIQKQVESFIQKSEDRLTREITDNSYELYIEFFLPLKYLYNQVEKFQLENEWDEYIGKKHVVVVRSHDRLTKPGLRNPLRQGMERLNKQFTLRNQQILREIFEDIQELSCGEWERQINFLKEKIGIKFICPASMSENDRIKIFKVIIKCGIPIAIWTRNNQILRLEDEIEQICTPESSTDLNFLLKNILLHIFNKRELTSEEEAYNLGVLCEVPELDTKLLNILSPLS